MWRFLKKPERVLDAKAYSDLGDRHFQHGDHLAARDAYEQSLSIDPDQAQVRYHYGLLLLQQGQAEPALEQLQAAAALDSGHIKAHLAVAELAFKKGMFDLARRHYGLAAELQPGKSGLWSRLGKLEFMRGNARAAADCYERAWNADNKAHVAASNYLYCSAFCDDISPRQLADRCIRWGNQQYALKSESCGPAILNREVDPDRRLRIGYLSPDFREHSLRFFFQAIAEHHDRKSFELFCYSDTRKTGSINSAFRSSADAWRDVADVDDGELAALIRQDNLDILVELAGHTRNNRLPMLATRLAPIQITALGYPGTTGLPSIDYKLSDPIADPIGAEAYYSETLLRLPECFWCFSPPQDSPDVAPAPCLANRHITFGCFGEPCKITDSILRIWHRILLEMPTARMVIKLPRWIQEDNGGYLLARLERFGFPLDRIELQGPATPLNAFLQSYSQVDLVLDTFPFNGGTTTCLALWMGVPVITLAGDYLASRMGTSILENCGLHELVARTPDEYANLAVALAMDMDRIGSLRTSLRDKIARSSLTNGRRYTAHLEAAYRAIWIKWCAQRKPS